MSEIQVNTINEYTGANGVTIDGALIKDNFLAASAGGGLVKLGTHTFDNSGDDVTFNTIFDGTKYLGYKIVTKDILHATDGQVLRLKFRASSADILTGVAIERFAVTGATNSSASIAGSASNPLGYVELNYSSGNAAGELAMSVTELFPHGQHKVWYLKSYRTSADGTQRTINSLVAAMEDSTTVEGGRIYSTSGNVVSGTVDIWGMVK